MTVTNLLSKSIYLKLSISAAIALGSFNVAHAAPETAKPPVKKETPKKADPKKAPPAKVDDKKPAPAAALPVPSDPRQVFGWKENILIKGLKHNLEAKLDTGARTSSMHAESEKIFERDGKKWVRFKTSTMLESGSKSYELEAPLVRTTLIKEPNGESIRRNVVLLTFTIGDRQLRSEFTLNNRSNMICPVLIGRTAIKSLGWIDADRIKLADQKIFR